MRVILLEGVTFMDNNIRLIAVDLDGTLLNRKKEMTPRTKEALAACA